MANENTTANLHDPIKSIYMALVPPYGVYVNNVQVAEYATELEASIHYEKLRLLGAKQK